MRAFFHKESLWSLLAIREILNERNNVLELVKQAKKTHHRGTMCSKYYSCGTWDTEFHVGPPGCGFTSLLPPLVQHVQDEQTLKLHFQAPIKKKNKKKKQKTACNTGESWCAKFQVRVSFSKRSISFNASCENIIKRLTNYQWCQIFSAWTLQSVAWVTKQFSRTAGNRFWKTSKHGGGIISEERRAPATGSGVDADALLLYQDCLTSQNQRPQNWTQN